MLPQGSMSDLPKNGSEWHKIRNGYLSCLTQCSNAFNDLLLSLIHPCPTRRPQASDIEAHPLVCPHSDKSKVSEISFVCMVTYN